MQWSDIPLRPSRRVLRQFAGLLLVFAGAATVCNPQCWPWAMIPALMGGIGLLKPHLLRWLFVAWLIAVFPIGRIVSQLVLAIVYYGLVSPLGILFRLLGRDALWLRRRPETASYWIARPHVAEASRYFRQF